MNYKESEGLKRVYLLILKEYLNWGGGYKKKGYHKNAE